MSTIYDDSVFQIQSQDKNNSKFGTGFVFYVDEKGSYLATCNHVLEQVENPLINNQVAKVIANGSEKNIDLAVLFLEGVFLKSLKLQALDCKNGDVKLVGYSNFTREQDQVKEREATLLGDKVKLKNKENNNTHYAWQIIAKDNFEIESGNSGGPLLCNVTQKVMAVMSHNVKGGEGGFAIDIEHLKDIWQEIPKELFDVKENPYKGLSSFSFEDREKYFGREEEQENIAKILEEEEM